MAAPDPHLVRAGSLAELQQKGCLVVTAGSHGVAVFWHEGRPWAVDNRCPHMGFPLSRGTVRDGLLTCHWHHARFDLASGGTLDPFADDVRAYPTVVRDGDVFVDVRPEARSKRAWCQWQVTSPASTVPWWSGKPRWGHRSSMANARPSCHTTSTGSDPTFVSRRPSRWRSSREPARVAGAPVVACAVVMHRACSASGEFVKR